ncbi:MAG: flagellar biosynthetic protein FliO [Acidobacteriia bacterium]|nr:flagellar biosynthetic protein FliO [Terriglobia bacterium]
MTHSKKSGKPKTCARRAKPKYRHAVQQLSAAFRLIATRVVTALRNTRISKRSRRLRLSEVLPLGGRRFIALVRVDADEFLVGATGDRLSLLARIADQQPVALLSEANRFEVMPGAKVQ